MKKRLIIGAAAAALVTLLLTFIYFNPIYTGIPDGQRAEIIYINDGKNIKTTADEKDSEKLRAILNNRFDLFWDTPSCPYSENVSVRFGGDVFCPACDSCGGVKLRNKYIGISEKDTETIRGIMKKYGAVFPCV